MRCRKLALAALTCVFLLAGCGRQKAAPLPPLAELPEDYGLEQAKEDGCVVHENGDITSGQEAWEAFLQASSAGKAAAVRLANYYTLDNPSRYDPEYYESIKDDYPLLYVSDLTFDGRAYTVSSLEDGERLERTFSHLKYFEGEAETPGAVYDAYIRYVLVNDDTATWDRLMHGIYSSRFGDYIPFDTVYTDYIYENEAGS